MRRLLPSVLICLAAIVGCDLTPPARPMEEPSTIDEDDPTALMPEPHKAEGALAQVTVVVHGKAPDRYRQALERALGRAGVKIAEQGATADLELDLDVGVDPERMVLENESSSDETVEREYERFLAHLVVTRGGNAVATIDSTPRFELRTVTSGGNVLKTKRTLDQADIEFCGAGMNGLVTKLVHSAAVNEAATAAKGGAK